MPSTNRNRFIPSFPNYMLFINFSCFHSFVWPSRTGFIRSSERRHPLSENVLSRIYIFLLCENCINRNCVELVHSAFQVYYVLLLLCIFILLGFESLILKLQLKILAIFLKIVIYSETICNFVQYFPSLL